MTPTSAPVRGLGLLTQLSSQLGFEVEVEVEFEFEAANVVHIISLSQEMSETAQVKVFLM